MLELIREASTTQFVALIVAFVCAVMITLQIIVRRGAQSLYLIGFFVSVIVLLVSLR